MLRRPLRSRSFRALWLAQLTSELGDWAGRIALSVLVLKRTGSPLESAAVTTVSLAPFVFVGPVITGWASKFERRSLLITCDVLRAAAFGVMALSVPIWTLFALALLAGVLTPPFHATRSASLPNVTDASTYPHAVTLTSITTETSVIGGYLLGGALFVVATPATALALDAFTFLVSAVLLSTVQPGALGGARATTELRAGLRAIFGDAVVSRYVVAFSVVGGFAMSGVALAPALVAHDLHRGPGVVALLAALVSVGGIVTASLLPTRGSDIARVRLCSLVALLGAVPATLGFASGADVPLVGTPFLALGVIFASRIPGIQLLGTRIADDMRAAAFAVALAALALGQAFGPLVVGAVANVVGPRTALVMASAGAAAVAAIALAMPLRDARHAASATPGKGDAQLTRASRR